PTIPNDLRDAVRRWFRVLELGFATGQCQPLLDQVREDLPSLDGRPEERLHIDPELGVTETALAQPDSAYGFRYEGLKLLLRADSRYFLVPASWSAHRRTVLLPESESVRVEFVRTY
ncbi:MAG TPA: hypothetical protein VHF00_04680, partial [Acidimicrobiales bacterium]|nr:hypothetical protein [Acidimicrobiales bacterium]